MAIILIVDDLPANRKVLCTILGSQGHLLLEAADGREGLAVVQAERPDLVITDVLMPVMDGYEFVRQLRLNPTTKKMPVLFWTAHYGEREAKELALTCGVSYVLKKPVDVDELLNVVGRVLCGDLEAPGEPVVSPLTVEFDREHLRLVTDKLSERGKDLKTANERLRALINIGLELASERDAGQLLRSVCEAARDLFGVTYVTLGIVDRTHGTVQDFVTCGLDDVHWMKTGDAVSGILETVIADRRMLRGENPGGDPGRLHLPALHPEVEAFLAAPIVSPSQVYGWICLVRNDRRRFSEDDEHLVMALAGQLGRIYENGHLYSVAKKRAEEAQRYLDTGEVILLALDVDGRVTLANRCACFVLGWTAEELLGRDWITMCVPASSGDALRAKFHELLRGDLSISESPVLTKSGHERLIEWRNTVLRDDTEHVIGTFSSGLDITERKRAEEEVRQRAQLSALSAAVGLAMIDADSLGGALQRCAEALVTYLGAADARIWTLNKREGMLDLQACAGPYANSADGKAPVGQVKIRRIASDRKPHVTNTVIGDPDLSQEWARRAGIVAFAGHPLIVADHVVGVMALFVRHPLSDAIISALASVADHVALGIERHRSAEALRSTEERTRFALQSADVGIWDMDYGSGVLRWSETMEAQYGLSPGTFDETFAAFIDRVYPADRKALLETVTAAMTSGEDFSTLHRALWPDGRVRWLSGAGRVLLGERGEPLRGVGISQDITERRTLEEQYQQAQKMEAVGRLAGGVAHDFNNLLTVILGSCDILLEDLSPNDPRQVDIAEIQKAGARAAGLTRQLLAFSRKEMIEPRLLDLNLIASDMQVMLRRLIGEDVQIMMALRPELAPIMADRGQVEQIVMNLAVNARDAMPKGGVLTIETANVELDEHYAKTHAGVKPGRYVALTVTDTGTGMTQDVQARLFEPFFTTKEIGKGTGLGMATVYGIATRAGGTIGVYSEVGRGTSLKVYFPRADEADFVVEAPAPVARPRSGTQTVLVVDDQEELRELARRLLQRQGYTALVAANAPEALQLFEDHPSIDVLLTDVIMPGASGPELTRLLVEQRPGLRVIYMSGYTEEGIVHHGVLEPGIAFLHKPFTSGTLGQKIRDVLER